MPSQVCERYREVEGRGMAWLNPRGGVETGDRAGIGAVFEAGGGEIISAGCIVRIQFHIA